jgi:hypothetical protein
MDENAGHEARRARQHHQRRRFSSSEEGRRGEGRATRHHQRGTYAASVRQPSGSQLLRDRYYESTTGEFHAERNSFRFSRAQDSCLGSMVFLVP